MTDAALHNLSRAKIQRLLTAVGSTAAQGETQPELNEYDWRDPHYFSEDQRNRLAAVMSQVAALLSERFVHFYGSESNATPASVTQHFADDLPHQITLDRSFCLAFGPDPIHPCGFLTVGTETALNWVTLLLGDSESDNDPNRMLSPLEESLLSDVVTTITDTFLASLRPHQDFKHDSNLVKGPAATQFEPTEEICMIAFEVKRADANEASQMRFVLPCRMLAPLVGRPLQPAAKLPQEGLQRIMTAHLQQMPVTITARLSSTRLSFEEALDLSQDDIVLLNKQIDELVDLIIDNQPVFRGHPVQSGGRHAVLITECTVGPAHKASKAPAAK
jgi:flagellar motor switch protein FliM